MFMTLKTQKNLSKWKIKEIQQNVIELEEILFRNTEYQIIRDVANSFNGIAFNQSTDEDYYKPGWIKSTFNGNYIEYESKGDKNKNLLQGEYLDIIRSYLSDLIIDYKTQGK